MSRNEGRFSPLNFELCHSFEAHCSLFQPHRGRRRRRRRKMSKSAPWGALWQRPGERGEGTETLIWVLRVRGPLLELGEGALSQGCCCFHYGIQYCNRFPWRFFMMHFLLFAYQARLKGTKVSFSLPTPTDWDAEKEEAKTFSFILILIYYSTKNNRFLETGMLLH